MTSLNTSKPLRGITYTRQYALRCSQAFGAGRSWACNGATSRTVIWSLKNNMSYDGMRPPKNGKTRIVPISAPIAKILKEQKDWQRENKEKMWSKYFRSDFVITRKDGTLIDPKLLSRRFGEVQKRNQLESVRFHDLRHTAASLMILEGVPLKDSF